MSVLVVEHEADAPLGLLERPDMPAHVVRPYLGETVPGSLAPFSGLVVLGGEPNAYEDERYPWLPATRELIATAARTDVPTLLVCLGHQLGAVALGGRVERMPGTPMWGTYEVGLTTDARTDPIFSRLTAGSRVTHWNGDIVSELPAGAVALARDERGGVQIARYAPRMWGIQCHPEVDADILERWGSSVDAATDPDTAQRVLAARAAYDRDAAAIRSAWAPVLDALVATLT